MTVSATKDQENLIERLRAVAAEGELIHLYSYEILSRLLTEAADFITGSGKEGFGCRPDPEQPSVASSLKGSDGGEVGT
ncbi:MAG: hypothetical protein Q7T61_01185 [Caulobacter sp.]|nr:hypothetical protein [Caulobacter sp.]